MLLSVWLDGRNLVSSASPMPATNVEDSLTVVDDVVSVDDCRIFPTRRNNVWSNPTTISMTVTVLEIVQRVITGLIFVVGSYVAWKYLRSSNELSFRRLQPKLTVLVWAGLAIFSLPMIFVSDSCVVNFIPFWIGIFEAFVGRLPDENGESRVCSRDTWRTL